MTQDPYRDRHNTVDPYVNPGSDVLKNRPGFRDAKALAAFEKDCVAMRELSLPKSTSLTPDSYRAVHKHLFQDVYAWAGDYRSVTLFKANVRFCHADYIDKEMNKRFEKIARDPRLLPQAKDRAAFTNAVGEHICELNSIHPFREGNGRAMRAFIGQLAHRAGYQFNDRKLDRRAWLNASAIGHIQADYKPMQAVIESGLSERQLDKTKQQQSSARQEKLKKFSRSLRQNRKKQDQGLGD